MRAFCSSLAEGLPAKGRKNQGDGLKGGPELRGGTGLPDRHARRPALSLRRGALFRLPEKQCQMTCL